MTAIIKRISVQSHSKRLINLTTKPPLNFMVKVPLKSFKRQRLLAFNIKSLINMQPNTNNSALLKQLDTMLIYQTGGNVKALKRFSVTYSMDKQIPHMHIYHNSKMYFPLETSDHFWLWILEKHWYMSTRSTEKVLVSILVLIAECWKQHKYSSKREWFRKKPLTTWEPPWSS